MTTPDNRALWELVEKLRERENRRSKTDEYQNGIAMGSEWAADELAAILERPVVVGGRPPREWTEAAYASFLRINDGDEDKAKTDLGTWAIGTNAALESMVRGKS